MRVVLIFTFLLVVYSQTIEPQRNITESEQFINDYKDKICRSEKTCHLVGMVNASLQTLKERNCMCDENCTRYGDCCEDSEYINNAKTQKVEYFHCPPVERIYMKTLCPADYPNQSVKSKCESSMMKNLEKENKKLFIPVTNLQKNITYGNEYCAVCNNEFIYKAWNLTTHCTPVKKEKDPTPSPDKTNNYSPTTEGTLINPTTTKYVDYYALNMEEAKKRIKFNSTSKTFYSEYNGTKYECWYSREKPKEFEPHFRDCGSAILNCSLANSTLADLCKSSYTSIVYDDENTIYKNKYCAMCNNVTSHLRGCLDPGHRVQGSSLFTTSDKGPGKPPCNASVKVKDKFCS